MKNEEEETKAAAFSIYYGLNDSRNNTERVTIQKNQTLDHVYTMGVIRALENYQDDDASTLNIFTGSKSVRDGKRVLSSSCCAIIVLLRSKYCNNSY